MPIYGYRCSRGHQFEVMQRITEEPLTTCPECGAPVIRVFHPVGIIFKGQGFYKTDSRGTSSAVESGDGKGAATTKETPATPTKETKDTKDTKDTGSTPAPASKSETTSS
ncbi:MAG TPA: FmdB family zinc ribbon protein [Candidatus Limnocylindrales bacterium]|nr:FmdB family zinc ribbon protein [Candidatus Limnocylindrales bacterium]